jgi:hypothetical protein
MSTASNIVRASFALGLIASAIACGSETSPISGSGDDPNGSPQLGGSGSGTGAAGGGGGTNTGAKGFCSATGGIALPGTTLCTSDLAKRAFRFAVCSCEPLALNGEVKTRSFDSSAGKENATGGSIGANAALRSNGTLAVGGSLWTPANMVLSGTGLVSQELRAGQGITVAGEFTVERDLYASAAPIGSALTVKGSSHVPASVAPPCDCSHPIAIASYVDAFAKDNDDAASDLTPASLSNIVEPKTVTLGCGRYYFDEITAHDLTLKLLGRTAIFVKHDVMMNGELKIELAPSAELDLFVAGDLSLNGEHAFGSVDTPAHVRLYVDGPNVLLNGAVSLAANLYAPNAVIRPNGAYVVRGAVFGKGFEFNGGLDVAYDEAILKVQGCEAPGGSCSSCNECTGATPACRGGKCVACESDADCCAPLLCRSGACVPSIR